MNRTPLSNTSHLPRWIGSILLVMAAGLISDTIPASGIDIHDPEIIKQDDTYYIFSTGRRGAVIQALRSEDLRTWQRIPSPFSAVPEWVQEEIPRCRGFWAPAIHHIKDRYHLYYSASSFGSQHSLIGMTTNVTLNPEDPNYLWVDQGKVIASREGMNYNAIDPAIINDTDGGLWMTFGSFWGGIMLVELHPETGKPFSDDSHVIVLARRPDVLHNPIEAPYLIYRQGYYYLFVSFDHCCRRAESTYKIMVGRSESVTGPYVDRDGTAMLDGGGTLILESDQRWKGPGHNSVLNDDGTFYLVHHAYDAQDRGMPKLHIRPLTWTRDGWPRAGRTLEGLTLVTDESAQSTP